MRKIISLFAAVTGITTTASSVVGCGVSVRDMMERKIDPEIYSSVFYSPVSSWNTAIASTGDDFKFLSDTQGTLVRTNRFNREIGELALNYFELEPTTTDKSVAHAAKAGDGGGTGDKPQPEPWDYTYYINPEAHWTDSQGNDKGEIDGQDFQNMLYTLLSPDSMSYNSSYLTSFFASDIDFLQDDILYDRSLGQDPSTWIYNSTGTENDFHGSEVLNDFISPGQEEINGTKYNTVTFHLVKKCDYFDSVLTNTILSPLPDFAVKLVHDSASGKFTPTSTSFLNYGLKYTTPWCSGGYIVQSYQPNSSAVLVKNKNYAQKDLVFIKKIKLIQVRLPYPNKERTMFESGDINDASISSLDLSGWNKYVGDNVNSPSFEGTTSIYSPDSITFSLMFNYGNTRILKDGTHGLETLALESPYIRAYIAASLNRSTYASYYSNGLDQYGTSAYVRNSLISEGFALNKSYDVNDPETGYADYNDYISQEVTEQIDVTDEEGAKMTKDGYETFYNNDSTYTFDGKFDSSVKNRQDLIKKVQGEIFNLNRAYDGNIAFDFLTSGTNGQVLGKNFTSMISQFNETARNDGINITINPIISNNSDSYLAQISDGNYDMTFVGWQPDFADPSTFFTAMEYSGAMDSYFGGRRILGLSALANPDSGSTTLPDDFFGKVGDKLYKSAKSKMVVYSYASKLATSFKNYLTLVNNVTGSTETLSTNERYTGLAKAEFDLIYRDNLILPAYIRSGNYKIKLSYVKIHTAPTVEYGSSMYKHVGVELTNHLLNRYERQIIEANYQEELKYGDGL
jgi:oligopeptide transport system substrate-binding protein